MPATTPSRTRREDRLVRRMVARGEAGLAEALCALKGVTFGHRYVFRSLYAIGGEGAVYDVDDLHDPAAAPLVGKVALHPVHQPFELTAEGIRERRLALRRESVLLATCGGDSMPADVGHYQFTNPALDAGRGDAFAEAEPVLLMEKLPGLDLDRWLARTYRHTFPPSALAAALDRFAVALLEGIEDLADRGFLYADLRPGNVRVLPQPWRHIRLLDAGSLVRESEVGEGFPHVPAYLPPELFVATTERRHVAVSYEVMAEMAGRSLFEIATGEPPYPGEAVDVSQLEQSRVSPRVAEVVSALATGSLRGVGAALEYLDGVVEDVMPPRAARPRYGVAAAAGDDDGDASPAEDDADDWCPADFLSQGDVAMPGRSAATAPAAAPESPREPAAACVVGSPADPADADPPVVPDPPSATRSWWRRLLNRIFRA